MKKGMRLLAAVAGGMAFVMLTACAAGAREYSQAGPEEKRQQAGEEKQQKKAAQDTELPEIYRDFLDGASASVTADWYEPDYGYSGSDRIEPGKEYTLAQLTDIIVTPVYAEWEQQYLGMAEYALFDSGADGEKELAVRLNKVGIDGPDDSSTVTFILKEIGGILYLCDAFDNWSRGECVQYFYGLREGGGSAGAGDHLYRLALIDREGRKREIYSCETLEGPWMRGLDEETWKYCNEYGYAEGIRQEIYLIGGTQYCVFEIEYALDESRRAKEKEVLEKLISCYKEEGVELASSAEVSALKEERERVLEISKEWYVRKELEWRSVPKQS